jgi:hypothetical protein
MRTAAETNDLSVTARRRLAAIALFALQSLDDSPREPSQEFPQGGTDLGSRGTFVGQRVLQSRTGSATSVAEPVFVEMKIVFDQSSPVPSSGSNR